MIRRTVRKAFTLVEILIVVVILGILAAIVVPQFTNATQDAQAGNLKAQLSSLNRQIELYRARNQGVLPASATLWIPLTTIGPFQMERNQSMSSQDSDGSNCSLM